MGRKDRDYTHTIWRDEMLMMLALSIQVQVSRSLNASRETSGIMFS